MFSPRTGNELGTHEFREGSDLKISCAGLCSYYWGFLCNISAFDRWQLFCTQCRFTVLPAPANFAVLYNPIYLRWFNPASLQMSGDYASCSTDNTVNEFDAVIVWSGTANLILINTSIASLIEHDQKSPYVHMLRGRATFSEVSGIIQYNSFVLKPLQSSAKPLQSSDKHIIWFLMNTVTSFWSPEFVINWILENSTVVQFSDCFVSASLSEVEGDGSRRQL